MLLVLRRLSYITFLNLIFKFLAIFLLKSPSCNNKSICTLNMQRTNPCMLRKRPLDWEFGAPFHKSWPWKIIHLQRDCMGTQYPWSHKAPFKIYDVLLQQKRPNCIWIHHRELDLCSCLRMVLFVTEATLYVKVKKLLKNSLRSKSFLVCIFRHFSYPSV